MWLQKNQWDRKDGVNGIVAVAIDSDKGSQNALKWAIDHLLTKGSTVVLIHVKVKPVLSASPTISSSTPRSGMNGTSELGTRVCKDPDEQTKEIFRPYRVFCARKDIQCKDIVLEHGDVAKALTEYVSQSAIEHLVIGSSNKNGFLKRFKVTDIPATMSKAAPDFCTVYVVTKGKIQSMRSASRAAPTVSPLQTQLSQASMKSDLSYPRVPVGNSVKGICCFIKTKDVQKYIFLDDNVEDFIKSYNLPLPKKYTYGEVKRITNSFRDKLGQGGYGVVCKASLFDGCQVAVKLIKESKGNGEQFINEVTFLF